MQRRPHSSLRPKKSEVPRWEQCSSNNPTRPALSRKATRSSPSRRTRTGGQSGSGISLDSKAGIQYRRINSPIGFPGLTWVSRSLSSRDSIIRSCSFLTNSITLSCGEQFQLAGGKTHVNSSCRRALSRLEAQPLTADDQVTHGEFAEKSR